MEKILIKLAKKLAEKTETNIEELKEQLKKDACIEIDNWFAPDVGELSSPSEVTQEQIKS